MFDTHPIPSEHLVSSSHPPLLESLDETKNKNIDIKSIQSCSAGVDSYQIPSLSQPNVVSVAQGRDEDNRKSFCLLS